MNDQTGLGLSQERATILGKLLPGFNYPERYCPYCEQRLNLEQAVHIIPPSDFKAVYFCMNHDCGAFDLEARKAYVRIYYSTPRAEELLFGVRIYMPVEKKD